MALQLESLIFDVQTSALKDAVDKIDNLSSAIGRLNKAQADETKTAIQAEKLKQAEAKTITETAKAKEAEAKAEQSSAKAKQASSKAIKEVTEATEDSNKVLQRQKEVLDFMTQGFSRGQASTLAYAKASGAAASEVKELGNVLQTQRKLIGGDVFDKSLSGLTALKNQLGEVREAYRQYGNDVELSRNQTRELARDKERIIERMKQEGASFGDIKQAIRAHNNEYIKVANSVNNLLVQEKELERQHRESANAARALAAEDERMASIMGSMKHNTNGVTTASQASAIAIAKYERNLRLAGVGAQEAASKLALYKKQMLQVQEIEQTRRAQHLSRALTPQISDVVTSLAGGMPLHLVIMQQGLQIRDLIALSGVEAEKLREVFKTASGDMIRSLTGTAKAISTLLVGSLMSAGRAVVDGLVAPFKLAIEAMKALPSAAADSATAITAMNASVLAFKGSMEKLFTVLKFTGIGAILAIVGALVHLDSLQSKLAKSTNLYGASLGMNANQALKFAVASDESTSAVVESISAISKAGGFTQEQMQIISKSAIEMNKTFGLSIEEVVGKYDKLREDPVKALLELQSQTGNVNKEVIESVKRLTEQGNTYKATEVAIKEYAKASSDTSKKTLEDLGKIGDFVGKLKNILAEFFKDIQRLALIAAQNIAYVFNAIGDTLGGVAAVAVQAAKGNFSGAAAIWEEMGVTADENRVRIDAMNEALLGKPLDNSLIKAASTDLENLKNKLAEVKQTGDTRGVLERMFTDPFGKSRGDTSGIVSDLEAQITAAEQRLIRLQNIQKEVVATFTSGETQQSANAILAEWELKNQEIFNKSLTSKEKYLQEMKRLDVEYAKGIELGASPEQLNKIREAQARLTEEFKKKSGATKEAEAVTKAYEKALDDFQKMQVKASGKTDELTQAQTLLLNIMRGDEWAKFTEERKLAVLEEFKLAHAAEVTSKAYQEQKKALEELQKLYVKADTDITKREATTSAETRSLEHQISLLGKSEEEVKKLNREFKLQEDILNANTELYNEQVSLLQEYAEAASTLDGDKLEQEAARIMLRLEALQADSLNRIRNLQTKANLDVMLEQEKTWRELRDVLSESVWLGLTEGGEKGADYLKNYLKNAFKKFVINVLINPIMGQVAGGLTGLISGGSGGGSGGTADIFMKGAGLFGNTGGFGAGFASGLSEAAIGSSFVGPSATLAPGAIGQGATVGSAVGGAIMPGLAGYGIAQKYGTGAGIIGGAATTAMVGGIGGLASGAGFLAGAGGALAAMGPVGWMALAIGAILGGMGPNKPTNYWQGAAIDTKTGVVSKTGSYDPKSRRYDPVNRAVADQFGAYLGSLSQTLSRITGETIDKKIRIGVGSKDKHFTIDGVKTELKGGTNEELINMAATHLVDLVYDKLSDAAKGVVDALREDGMKIESALVWVVEGLPELNTWLDRFGVSVLDINIKGVKAAEALAELVGGIENLAALQGGYVDNFFSDAEKVIFMNEDLTKEFNKLGLGMVNSREGFRDLVAAQDLNTEAGREAYAGLLKLAPAMDQYLNLLDAQVNGEAKAAAKAYAESLKIQIKLFEESVVKLSQLSQLLRSTLDSMRLGTIEESRMMRNVAMAKVSSALTTARTTGELPDADVIAPYLRILAEPSEQLYSSFEDYMRDFYLAKNDIFALAELSEDQLTVEERTLSWMKERAEFEDDQYDKTLEQLNINNVAQEKQNELLLQIRSIIDEQGLFSKDTDPTKKNPGDRGVREQMSDSEIAAAQAALAGIGVTPGGTITEEQAMLIYEAYKSGYAANLGVRGLSDIDQLLGQRVGTAETWLRQRGLPAFANGGTHMGGFRKVGEFGPEVEFTPPSQIYNRRQMNSIINIEPIIEELRSLRNDVGNLERAQSATASNTYRAARSLDEIVYNGVETTPA